MFREMIFGTAAYSRINDSMQWEIVTENGRIIATGDTFKRAMHEARKIMKGERK